MRIFIFVPAATWEYCGGMALAIARDFDEAVRLLKERQPEENFYARLKDIPGVTAHQWTPDSGLTSVDISDVPLNGCGNYLVNSARGLCEWVLIAEYELAGDPQPSTHINYRYA